MNLEGIMLSEVKDKYKMISFIYGIWKAKQINKQNRNKLGDTENKQVVSRGEGWEGISEIGEGD